MAVQVQAQEHREHGPGFINPAAEPGVRRSLHFDHQLYSLFFVNAGHYMVHLCLCMPKVLLSPLWCGRALSLTLVKAIYVIQAGFLALLSLPEASRDGTIPLPW